MTETPMEKLLSKVGSLYKLVVLTSRRTVELSDGAARLVDAKKDAKPFDVAIREIAEGRISYKAKEKK